MRSYVLVLLLSAVVACAYASAGELEEEEVAVDKRFLFKKHHNPFKKIGDKIKHAVQKVTKDVVKTAKKVVDKVGDTGKKVVDKVGDTGKKIVDKVGDTAKKVVEDIVKTFKVEGRYVNHFFTKSGKEVGHFFVKEGKDVGHTLVVAGKIIEHIGRDVYEEARDEVKKELKKINYDDLLHKVVEMIDSGITNLACSEAIKKIVVAIGGPELEPAMETGGPLIKIICKAALHLIEMGAEEGIKHVHINDKIHKKLG